MPASSILQNTFDQPSGLDEAMRSPRHIVIPVIGAAVELSPADEEDDDDEEDEDDDEEDDEGDDEDEDDDEEEDDDDEDELQVLPYSPDRSAQL